MLAEREALSEELAECRFIIVEMSLENTALKNQLTSQTKRAEMLEATLCQVGPARTDSTVPPAPPSSGALTGASLPELCLHSDLLSPSLTAWELPQRRS